MKKIIAFAIALMVMLSGCTEPIEDAINGLTNQTPVAIPYSTADLPIVATPVFAPVGGTILESGFITINVPDFDNAQIHYDIDGTSGTLGVVGSTIIFFILIS